MAREKTLAKAEHGELQPLEPWDTFKEMERMFRDFFSSPFSLMRPPRWWIEEKGIAPLVDLKETEKEFVLKAEIPGVSKEDINIDATRDTITISGEHSQEEEKPGERYHIKRRQRGAFEFSYSLPQAVRSDKVKASYKDGVLEVILPKAEITESHKIKIE